MSRFINDSERNFARALGASLRSHRERLGLSQGEVGKHISRSFAAISRIENGHTDVSIAQLRRLAKLYGKSATIVLYEAEMRAQYA